MCFWSNWGEQPYERTKANSKEPPIEPLPRGRALPPTVLCSRGEMAGDEQNVKLADYKACLRFGADWFAS